MSIESLLTNFLSYEKAIKKQIRKNKEAKWLVKAAVNSAASKNYIDELIGLITKLNTKESISITIKNQEYKNKELTESILLALKWFKLNFKNDQKYQGLFKLQGTLEELNQYYVSENNTQSNEYTNNQSDTESHSTNDEESDVFYDAQGEEPDVSNIENDTQSNEYTSNQSDTESHSTNDEESDANTGEQTLIQRFYQKITELRDTIVNSFKQMFGTRQTTENAEEQQKNKEPTTNSTSEPSNLVIRHRNNSELTTFSSSKPNLDPEKNQPEPTKPKTALK